MGSIIGRTRKDGTTAYLAQILIKRKNKIVHREHQTFDRKQAAKAWLARRETELSEPGAFDTKYDVKLSEVTHDGGKHRMLNVIDEFTHECLAIRVARKRRRSMHARAHLPTSQDPFQEVFTSWFGFESFDWSPPMEPANRQN